MNEIKIIIRKTNYYGMEKITGKIISAKKDEAPGMQSPGYIVLGNVLKENKIENEGLCKNEWYFCAPWDVIEEVEETK